MKLNSVYRILIFPAVVYGYKNWVFTEKEENGLRVFEN